MCMYHDAMKDLVSLRKHKFLSSLPRLGIGMERWEGLNVDWMGIVRGTKCGLEGDSERD